MPSFKIGEPLPYDLQNDDGLVVFRKGFVVRNEASLKTIENMDLKPAGDTPPQDASGEHHESAEPRERQADDSPGMEPMRRIDRLADRLSQCCSDLTTAPAPPAARILLVAEEARKLYRLYGSACIAAVHFRHQQPVSALHPIYSLFLAKLIASALGEESFDLVLSKAALTANLGMYEFQDQWANQSGRLTQEQLEHMRKHPQLSVERLKAVGVTDRRWLEIVEQHHERPDGGGYPRGLAADKICIGAILLGMIDRYLSFVMPRADRKWTHPTVALKIMSEDMLGYPEKLFSTFVRLLGVYPPGTSVRLNNGEIAVVTCHRACR